LAVLRFAVLRFAVLRLAVLRFAVERFAVLRLAVLRLAVVRFAVLRLAVLRLAVERFAVLRFAVLRLAVLRPELRVAVLLFGVAMCLLLERLFPWQLTGAQYARCLGCYSSKQSESLHIALTSTVCNRHVRQFSTGIRSPIRA
jgi:hypothetical protein